MKALQLTYQKLVDSLCENRIGAIARERAEAGPRALGNRSILGDPRNSSIKDRINGVIKKREAYRPLAPLCLPEDFEKYFIPFKAKVNYNYMSYAVYCNDFCIKNYPSIVHADGTARVQVVSERHSPFIFELLQNFRKATGSGLLINTSFNGPNEPIVNNLDDVLNAYNSLDLDFICIGDFFISRFV